MQQAELHAVALGEVLMDVFDGRPTVAGAPLNFAWYCKQHGAATGIVTAVGDDDYGHRIRQTLDEAGLVTDAVATAKQPTGRVDITLDARGVPTYTFLTPCAWDFIPDTPAAYALCRRADLVCYGSLACRADVSKAALQRLLAATRPDCMRVFDVNLRGTYYDREVLTALLPSASVLKISDEELPAFYACTMQGPLDTANPLEALRRYLAAYPQLQLIIFTRGGHGSVLLSRNAVSEHGGCPVTPVSTVGAGDSFTATVCMGLLKGRSLAEVNEMANRVASRVCTDPASTVILPPELRF